MLIGYARVSKADGSQTTDLQRDALLAAGVRPEHFYEDRASGKKDDRPGLLACLKALREGDVLVVWKLDRLGRNLHHLINTVHDLSERGIGLKVLTGLGAAINTTSPSGKFTFTVFAALAEFERDLIVERTQAGRASARARGRNGGRPYKMTTAKLRRAQAAMGQPETACRRAVRGAEHHPPNTLPTCRAEGRATSGWRKAAGDQASGQGGLIMGTTSPPARPTTAWYRPATAVPGA